MCLIKDRESKDMVQHQKVIGIRMNCKFEWIAIKNIKPYFFATMPVFI